MAEIGANQCHFGDKQQVILIKRNVSMYSERSYITEVFHGQRMFNTITTLSWFSGQKPNTRIIEY